MLNKINTILISKDKVMLSISRSYYEIVLVTNADLMNSNWGDDFTREQAISQLSLYAKDYNFNAYTLRNTTNGITREYLVIAEMFAFEKSRITSLKNDNNDESNVTESVIEFDNSNEKYIVDVHKIIDILNADDHIRYIVYLSNPGNRVVFLE